MMQDSEENFLKGTQDNTDHMNLKVVSECSE